MKAEPDDGGPAFPQIQHDAQLYGCAGMSLRDWFAGIERLADCDADGGVMSMTMCEALAGPIPTHRWDCNTPEEWLAILRWEAKWRAALRYLRADAMLAARKVSP